MAPSAISLILLLKKYKKSKKSHKSAEFSKGTSNESVSREISAKDYAKIEQIIRSISSPYESLPKPIRLVDMVEILDDIWEEDDTY